MIENNISKQHVLKALEEIDKEGIPNNRKSTKFEIIHNDKKYPPKYTLSLANRYANGKYLDASDFGGGKETNSYLQNLGFIIINK